MRDPTIVLIETYVKTALTDTEVLIKRRGKGNPKYYAVLRFKKFPGFDVVRSALEQARAKVGFGVSGYIPYMTSGWMCVNTQEAKQTWRVV